VQCEKCHRFVDILVPSNHGHLFVFHILISISFLSTILLLFTSIWLSYVCICSFIRSIICHLQIAYFVSTCIYIFLYRIILLLFKFLNFTLNIYWFTDVMICHDHDVIICSWQHGNHSWICTMDISIFFFVVHYKYNPHVRFFFTEVVFIVMLYCCWTY
jgi:hypothetical protein